MGWGRGRRGREVDPYQRKVDSSLMRALSILVYEVNNFTSGH